MPSETTYQQSPDDTSSHISEADIVESLEAALGEFRAVEALLSGNSID